MSINPDDEIDTRGIKNCDVCLKTNDSDARSFLSDLESEKDFTPEIHNRSGEAIPSGRGGGTLLVQEDDNEDS